MDDGCLRVFFSIIPLESNRVIGRPSITTHNPAECFRFPIDSRFPSRPLSDCFRPKIVLLPRGRKHSGAGNNVGEFWGGREKVM